MTTVPQAGDFITATFLPPPHTKPGDYAHRAGTYTISGYVYELPDFPTQLWVGKDLLTLEDYEPLAWITVTTFPQPEVAA